MLSPLCRHITQSEVPCLQYRYYIRPSFPKNATHDLHCIDLLFDCFLIAPFRSLTISGTCRITSLLLYYSC